MKFLHAVSIVLLAVQLNGHAQESLSSQKESLSIYQGKWLAIENDDSLTLNLVLRPIGVKGFEGEVALFGTYTYSGKSNIKIEEEAPSREYNLQGGVIKRDKNGDRYISITFADKITNVVGSLILILDDNNKDEFVWELHRPHSIVINDDEQMRKATRFSVPLNLTFKRVSEY